MVKKVIDVNDMIGVERAEKHVPNFNRFNFKINKKNVDKHTCYLKVAKKLIKYYKSKKINSSKFVFQRGVFEVLRHQISNK